VARSNVAVTVRSDFIVSLHAPEPEQAPLQPRKTEPEAGVSLSVTVAFFGKRALHVGPHEIPAGEEVTVPPPAPDFSTVSVREAGAAPLLVGTTAAPARPNMVASTRPTTPSPNLRIARTPSTLDLRPCGHSPSGQVQTAPLVPLGTDVPLARATVTIPPLGDGTVLFSAKSRVQGDSADGGGTVSIWLTIDGRRVGSVGVQRLASPFCESQRSISASYLAAGAGALSPGPHVVEVHGRADGDFIHLSLVRDLPLVWFD
jgi:hypothetical protein